MQQVTHVIGRKGDAVTAGTPCTFQEKVARWYLRPCAALSGPGMDSTRDGREAKLADSVPLVTFHR